MLALVEYGERAGSGLQGIFTTWEKVYHTSPKVEVSTSGVDRTTLILPFEGNQPDIAAMKLLYDNPDGIIIRNSTQEIRRESGIEMSKSSIENIASNIEKPNNEIKSGTETGRSSIETLISSIEFQSANSENKIKMLLKGDDSLTIINIASILKMSKSGVQKITDRLRSEGRLLREGSTKTGRWIVKD